MSLSALDIVALARSGFNAEQISLLNKAVLETPEPAQVSTQPTQLSTQSPEPTQPTEPTEVSEPSTVSTKQEVKAAPAPKTQDPAPAPAAQGPTMQDLFAKIAALETKISVNAINNIQQPEQVGVLTGEQVLANILDPREG
jgi:outer membrane biosynthesis protein TonB